MKRLPVRWLRDLFEADEPEDGVKPIRVEPAFSVEMYRGDNGVYMARLKSQKTVYHLNGYIEVCDVTDEDDICTPGEVLAQVGQLIDDSLNGFAVSELARKDSK